MRPYHTHLSPAMSGMSGMSGMVSSGVAPPTLPTVSSSRLWLTRSYGLYVNSDGTGGTPAIGGTIGSWRAAGGAWGTDLLAQPTASKRPTRETDGIKSDGTDDALLLPARITIAGDFTCYFVCDRAAAAENVIPVGGLHAGDFGDGIILTSSIWYAITATAASNIVDTDVDNRIRRMRRGGDTMIKAKNSASETDVGLYPEDMRFDQVLARGSASPIWQSANARLTQVVLVMKNITPGSTDDLAIISKLQELEPGVAGP